ncbi:helix-turn-helix transcriptional regulator [Stenotrophomonas sp. MMGLT7]|uniref:helix-turn-helix domain-containing protein n=1 Tax=Stenotrophomonas sp. MMGLT7 TaxID=2901227 RepID=UPI001E385160|nr:helix-turn-helix transcriptional regulator [Stenotrophomonas sp. MMGLT7]MCD7096918.1 helix-turn-helix domain-containing protein [Stenotrophomonas sp. MMGLT7]
MNRLLSGQDVARIELAKRMGVADGTLGRIKYGKANPTIDVVDKIARYFRMEPWELLRPPVDGVREQAAVYGDGTPALHEEIARLTKGQQRALLAMIREFTSS